MTAFTPFNSFVADMGNGVNAPGGHVMKLALTNTQPVVTQHQFNQINEISPGGGYAAGGVPLNVTSSGQVGGLWTLFVSNFTLLATGGAIPTWRWAVIYDAATGSLIGFTDYGSSVSLDVSDLVNFIFDQVNGLIQGVAASG